MINVAFFCYNIDDSGGLERVLSLIANELSLKKNIKVTIISIYRKDSTFFSLHANINVIYIKCKSNYFSMIKQTRNILNIFEIDRLVIVDTLLSLICVPSCIGLNIKTFGWEHYSFYSNLINKKRLVARFLSILSLDNIIVLTERDAQSWSKLSFNESKIITIDNPAPFIIKEKTDKKNCNYALAIGRLRYEKGFDLLIQAWSMAKEKLPKSAKLIIVGEGEKKLELEDQIKSLNMTDCIAIKDFTKDIEKYYSNAKIYCLTSRTEALPMVLIEALCFSTPLLAFDCYTGPREIIENGYNGFIVEENNIELYAQYIVKLFTLNSNDFSNVSNNAYLSSKKYSMKNIISKWLYILE